MPAIVEVEKRILQIAALFDGVKTPLEEPGERLTDDRLMAVITRGKGATRQRASLRGGLITTRDYVVYLLVARVEGKGKRRELAALDAAKAVINDFAAHFMRYAELQTDADPPLVYATEPMRDGGAELDTYEGDLISMVEFTLPVITYE